MKIELGDITVICGENKTGKTSLLLDIAKENPRSVFIGREKRLRNSLTDDFDHLVSASVYLELNGLIIIDDAGAGFHPSHQVEFALGILRMTKQHNIKVVLTTYCTDIVQAIDQIGKHKDYKLRDKTKFYLAEHSKETPYAFRDMGDDIDDIFWSFNKSSDKIQQYGEGFK